MSGTLGMRSRASGVARLETVAAPLVLFPPFLRLFTFHGRAMPDAQERIPTAPHAEDLPRIPGRAGAHPYRATRSSLLPRQLRNKVVWVRRLQFAGSVELRDLIRRKRPSDRAKVILELPHPSRPDDRCGYTWLLQEPVNCHLGRVPLEGSGDFVQTIQGMPRLLVIIGTPFFAPILLLGEFDT